MLEEFKKIKLTDHEREQARAALRAAMEMTPAEYMMMVHSRDGSTPPVFSEKELEKVLRKMTGKPVRKQKKQRRA